MRSHPLCPRTYWTEYCRDCYLEQTKPTISEFLRFYGTEFRWLLTCRIRGHDFVKDGSYAEPDSGRESFRCTRCGETYDITYY